MFHRVHGFNAFKQTVEKQLRTGIQASRMRSQTYLNSCKIDVGDMNHVDNC